MKTLILLELIIVRFLVCFIYLGILRRQLIRTEAANSSHVHQFQSIETPDGKTIDLSMDRYITNDTASMATTATAITTKINIQDEFIEEERTDSDVDPEKPDAQKKKKKIYRCKRCNKICNSKNALHYHFLSHTGERPYKCNECDKSFFAGSALKVGLDRLSCFVFDFFLCNYSHTIDFCSRCTSVSTRVRSRTAVTFAIGHSGSGVISNIIYNRNIAKIEAFSANFAEKIFHVGIR